jgi:hypothetical protein
MCLSFADSSQATQITRMSEALRRSIGSDPSGEWPASETVGVNGGGGLVQEATRC